jgi:hypothetical protein
MGWREAVLEALKRYCGRHFSRTVLRTRLIAEELEQIVADTGSRGRTPEMTLNRVLQDLRDEGFVAFIDNDGQYEYLGDY